MFIRTDGLGNDPKTEKAFAIYSKKYPLDFDLLLFEISLWSVAYYIYFRGTAVEVHNTININEKIPLFFDLKNVKNLEIVKMKLYLNLLDGSKVYLGYCASIPETNKYLKIANQYIEKAQTSNDNTVTLKTLSGLIEIDESIKEVRLSSLGINVSFADIRSFELIVDENTVIKTGLGHAVVGGVLLGGLGILTGAVLGNKNPKKYVENVLFQINTRKISRPIIDVVLNKTKIFTDSQDYKNLDNLARNLVSIFEIIVESNK